MTSNGDRFQSAYNKIDALLRKKIVGARTLSFSHVVTQAAERDPTVKAVKNDLLEYGDLRNAIVHDRGKAPVLLADPRDDVVVNIEKILNRFLHPKTLRSLPHRTPLQIFPATASLSEALVYMRTNDFSQVVVFRDEKHLILSTEGIAHWLEEKSKEDIIALSEATVRDVMTFEPRDSCIYLKANATADQAREVFVNDVGKRIFSALVTEHGNSKEKPINIVTPWDLVAGALE